jgi:hypothetical protein
MGLRLEKQLPSLKLANCLLRAVHGLLHEMILLFYYV